MLATGLLACGSMPASQASADKGATVVAAAPPEHLLTSGGNASFSLYTGTVIQQTGIYRGVTNLPPKALTDFNIVMVDLANANNIVKKIGADASQTPNALSANATLHLPRQGGQVWGINVNGRNSQTNTLAVDLRFGPDDFDPYDARLKLRVVAVPVFNPGVTAHPNNIQPFMFTYVDNQSRSRLAVASDFQHATQMGVPWQINGAYQYTDWQLIELMPSVTQVGVGDALRLSMMAAGCAPGGHYGAMYVDEVGRYDMGGTTLVADAPELVATGGNIRTTFRLRQSGGRGASNANITILPPAGTQFLSFTSPADWSCRLPAVLSSNAITCTVASLPGGYLASATLVVATSGTATNPVVLGNYGVSTDGQLNLLGPQRPTTIVTDANILLADLSTRVVEDLSRQTATTATLVVTVHNDGPTGVAGAAIVDAAGPHLVPLTYSCVSQGNASVAGSAQVAGTGRLTTSYNIASGANVVCTVVVRRDGSGILDTYGVAAQLPSDVTDPISYNTEGASFVQPNANAVATPPAAVGSCSRDAECPSGFCADGVCCDSACTGPCVACNLPATRGICSPLSGVEPLPNHPSCGPYVCYEGACLGACQSDEDCIATLLCQEGVCRPKLGACSVDADCAAGLTCTPAKTCESLRMQDSNHPNWTFEGSGCAAGPSTPGAGSGLLQLVALSAAGWMLTARRRRLGQGGRGVARAAAKSAASSLTTGLALFAALALLGAPVRAADSASVSTNFFLPLGGVDDIMQSAAAPSAATGSFFAGAWLNYAKAPLRLRHTRPPVAHRDIVAHQGTVDLVAGVALPWYFELDAALPGVVQKNMRAPFASTATTHEHLQLSLGDLRVTPKWSFLHFERVRLAIAAIVVAPTGRHNAFVGRAGLGVAPTLIAEFGRLHGLRVLLNGGVLLQKNRTFGNIHSHNLVRWSAASELPLPPFHQLLRVKATAYGQFELQKMRAISSPIEVLGGIGVALPRGLLVDLAGGIGLNLGYGAPKWRVLATVAWRAERTEPQDLPVPVAEVLPAADANTAEVFASPLVQALDPNGDEDHDGVLNAVDACPTIAGDANGVPPGCPTVQEAQTLLQSFKLAYFASGAAKVLASDVPALEQVRQVMAALPTARLQITGHTDNLGPARRNQRLSLARAEAALSWLVEHGVARDRMEAVGRGGSQPVDRRRTALARAKNRRVVFFLLPGPEPVTGTSYVPSETAPSSGAVEEIPFN